MSGCYEFQLKLFASSFGLFVRFMRNISWVIFYFILFLNLGKREICLGEEFLRLNGGVCFGENKVRVGGW